MRRRLIGLLLAGAMVLCLGLGALPRKAGAAAPTHVMVAETQVYGGVVTYWLVNAAGNGITDSGAGPGNYNVKYDPSSGVLTLKNAVFTCTDERSAGIRAGDGDFIIQYFGNNSVAGKQFGVSANDVLLIQAGEPGATLRAVGQDDYNNRTDGIRSMKQSVTIDGGSVTAIGGDVGNNSYGIEAGSGVRITGGSRVTATGGAVASTSIGMRAGSGGITVEGGSHLIASGKNQALFSAPNLAGNGGYEWRTGAGDAFSPAPYVWSAAHTFVEIAAIPAAASVPQTGDGAMPLLWAGLLALSGAGLAASALRWRKREE